jgi:hypothetical protein
LKNIILEKLLAIEIGSEQSTLLIINVDGEFTCLFTFIDNFIQDIPRFFTI